MVSLSIRMAHHNSVRMEKIATDARIKVLELIFKAQTSHIGSNFSAIDIMTVLFDKADHEKDEVILSAGWKAAAWYYFLWKKGVITEEELNSFCQEIKCEKCEGVGTIMIKDWDAYRIAENKKLLGCNGCRATGKIQSPFIGLTEPMGRWGLKFAGGSMGYGLPAAVGFALAKKLKGEKGKVYCLMSDGEIQIGTTWESFLIARQYKLHNLVVIVDANAFQAMGKVDDILSVSFPLQGWEGISIDGHNFAEVEKSLEDLTGDKLPKVIMANTTKGRGVSFMENNNLYHYKQLDYNEYTQALKELNDL